MDENSLFLSRLDDLIDKYYCGEIEGFGFLNELEVSIAHRYLTNQGIEHVFDGGYTAASRMFLYLTDSISDSNNDIFSVKISIKGDVALSHRDYLGSLMGLGINRDCVGDVILKDNFAVAFIRRELADYVLQNLTSVGRASVVATEFDGDTSDLNPKLQEIEVAVTSMRVDNLITSLCKCSRQKANDYISEDAVFINYCCINKPSKAVCTGDTVSIRGFGKFKIGEILRNTKSGRLVISVLQYK